MIVVSTFSLATIGFPAVAVLLAAVGGGVVLLAALRYAERFFR